MNENLMREVFSNEQKIGVAVSGGLDSVCLLDMCACFAKKHNKKLVVLHIHHGLRKESDKEEIFVQNLATKLNAEFCCTHLDVRKYKNEHKLTLEEAARILRYQAIEKMAKQNNVNFVCLAHNANDQAETILLHLSRGSGLQGACGMAEKNGMFVRPLLKVSRKELEQYEKTRGLSHMEDNSNASTEFSRNFVRLNVLPELEKLCKGATLHLAAFASKMQDVSAFIKTQTPEPKLISKSEVLISNFGVPKLILANQIHSAAANLGVCKDITEKHINDIIQLSKSETGSQIHLPHGLVAWKTAEGVAITKKANKTSTTETTFAVGKYVFDGTEVKVKKTTKVNFGGGILFVDAQKIAPNAVLRHPKSGDVFTKLGASGKKKLVDYFTDKKIPQHKRDEVVVVATGSQVLAVLGYDISENVKIDGNTKQILRIELGEEK